MSKTGFIASVQREVGVMTSRGSYLAIMVVVPVLLTLFFVGLLAPGLPVKVPSAVVDLDHSAMSRSITRNLAATELVEISQTLESYDQAMAEIRKGNIYGFFVIPSQFEKETLSGKQPTLEYFNNLTFFVPGTLTFKGFKTVAVTTSGGVMKTALTMAGAPEDLLNPLLQPVAVDDHPVGNPWLNYSIYLSPSFVFGVLALLIMVMTCFGITMEIKDGTSPQWLATAGGSMFTALAGKMLPHFVVWSVVGQFALSVMFCYNAFPCGNLLALSMAMELFIAASQCLALLFCCIVPNLRLSLTLSCLIGILSFSFAGYSFPVQSMYGAVAIFSYLVPVRYLFLIYTIVGLDSFPVYFARYYYLALTAFPVVAWCMIWRLKRACLKPVYVP